MKVAFCTLPLTTGHMGRGIGFYTQYLLQSLLARSDVEIIETIDPSKVKSADIVHYPFFDLFSLNLPLFKKFPTVVTIHDVTPLIFPQHYPPGIKGSFNLQVQKLSLKSVKAVVTDSACSKKDINKFLNVGLDKIHIVNLAAADHFRKLTDQKKLHAVRQKYHLPPRFAFYTGNVNWNKNLLNLSQACINAGLDLALAGSGFGTLENLDHPELRSYKEFREKYASVKNVHVLGFIPDEDLVAIYNLAAAALLPSFYEGFGLPILEAQACGTPVITSNISSMPEVAGEGALLVDPYNVGGIEESLKNITSDQKLRNELVDKGFENIKRFSWKKVAQDTVNVYESITSS